MTDVQPFFSGSRRQFLRASAAVTAATVLQACGTATPVQPSHTRKMNTYPNAGNSLRIIASSGFLTRTGQVETGLMRLAQAGFMVNNQEAAYRRYQRFAGTDAQRLADFQDVATGRTATPKVLLGARGGYGAIRLLSHIDWPSLAARMREKGTLFIGYSDVCALQLALLAQGKMCSFAGPMLYSEFGNPNPSPFTLQGFIDGTTQANHTVYVNAIQSRNVSVQGSLWGGNLSVLSSLAGTPYMPDINGGILFIEDVNEQPYQIERALQNLYLAGVLKKQQAIVLGDFRMGRIQDVYDPNYNLASVAALMQRVTGVPVLTGFPFGHIRNKATFPLGAQASIRPQGNGGYSVSFTDYPTLNPNQLSLNNLLPPPAIIPEDLNAEPVNDTTATDAG